MTENEKVFAVLDLTRPNWRKEIDPMKFKTFVEYKEALAAAFDEGLKELGIDAPWIQ